MKLSFSTLMAWHRCPKLYDLTYNQGYEPRSDAPHLLFGTLFHKFMEKYHQLTDGIDPYLEAATAEVEVLADSTEPPSGPSPNPLITLINELKSESAPLPVGSDSEGRYLRYSFEHLARLCLAYAERYPSPQAAFRPLEVERKSTLKVGDFEFGGTIDMIAEDKYGPLLLEHKTTGRLWGMADKARLSFQKVGYVLLAQNLGHNISRVMYNCAETKLNKVDRSFDRSFQRYVVSVADWEIDQFRASLERDAKRIAADIAENKFSRRMPDGCQMYGSCPFVDYCSTPPDCRQSILDFNFDKKGEE